MLPEVDLMAEGQPCVEVVQRDSSPGEGLDQRDLDRRKPIMPAEIGLDGGNKPIELFRRVRSAIKLITREQLRPRRLLRAPSSRL